MHEVYIHFIDGASIRFRAREFNLNVGRKPIPVRLSRSSTTMANVTAPPISFPLEHLPPI